MDHGVKDNEIACVMALLRYQGIQRAKTLNARQYTRRHTVCCCIDTTSSVPILHYNTSHYHPSPASACLGCGF